MQKALLPVGNSAFSGFCPVALQQGESDVETGGHDGHHAHELDKDVQGRAGSILEGVTYHRGIMHSRVLARRIG